MSINKNKTLVISLTMIIIFASYLKLSHGIETDEEMHVANLYRTSLNYKTTAFTINWDPYQLVTFVFFPLVYLFKNNNYDGIVLGLRIISLFFQFIFCCYLYNFSNKYLKINNILNYIICCLCFLTSPKVGYTFDHSNTSMWFVTIMALELYKTIYISDKGFHSYISGMAFSFAVLSHPGNIFLFCFVIFALLMKNRKKEIIRFIIPCVIMAIIFFLLFLKDNPLIFSDLIFFLKEFVNDGSHKSSIIGRIDIRIVLILLFLIVLAKVLKNSLFNNISFIKESTLCEIIYFQYAIFSIVYNLFINNAICVFSEKYIFLALWMLIINKNNDRLKFLGYVPLIHFAIIYIFSNQGIQSNAYYMLPITALIFAVYSQNNKKIINSLSIGLTLIAALLIVGYNVRVESTMPSNIFDNIYKNDRVLYGIKTLEHENDFFNEIKNVSLSIDKLTIISEHPHCLSYLYLNSEIIAPSCVSTPVYKSQWIDYFEYHNVESTYLLFDKDEYSYPNFFEKGEFGKYILDNYQLFITYEGNHFDIIKLMKI